MIHHILRTDDNLGLLFQTNSSLKSRHSSYLTLDATQSVFCALRYGFTFVSGGRNAASNLHKRTLISIFADIGGQRVGVCLRKSQRIWGADGDPLPPLSSCASASVCLSLHVPLPSLSRWAQENTGTNLLLYMLDCRHTQKSTFYPV